jgi:galactose mutarotase-like enzyme
MGLSARSPGASAAREYELRTISSAAGRLRTFAASAGTVCCSLRHCGAELLAQRRRLEGPTLERRATMGIPLLHPWANRLVPLDAFAGVMPPAWFLATAAARTVALEFIAGYDYAHVFSPLGSDFICFEPMTAPTNALCSGRGLKPVAPGSSYRAASRIEVRERSASP